MSLVYIVMDAPWLFLWRLDHGLWPWTNVICPFEILMYIMYVMHDFSPELSMTTND